ncbi:scarecrow-like protein 33 [Populus alba x Populus x berolinensis]|nr:scarecrow-like protein 33 [Populus alba x Populus x berolinensis]
MNKPLLHGTFLFRAAEKPFSDILDPKSSSPDSEVSDPNQIIKTVNSPPFFPESVFQTFPEQVDSSVNVALGASQLDVLFQGGTEETWEFHHQANEMILDFENNKVTPVKATKEKNYWDHSACELKERKNHYKVEKNSETRRNKHSSSVYAEAAEQYGMFAEVFPSSGGDDEPVWLNLNETFQNGPGMIPYLKEQSRGSNHGMLFRKNHVSCRELVHTRTLLIHCAEAVASNDHGSALELLTQIRQHSTPFGDGSQRLAHCFSNALEARMAGNGSQHLSVRPGGPPVLRITGIEFPQTGLQRINPAVFIHGIVNGAYNSPFFVSRFREALFYFSSLFDMLETITAREDPERLVFEQEVFGKEILNVIACEGCDRIERPEKYKQWQARNVRAGLRQLPLKEGIVEKVREQVKSSHHKDFLMDQDGQWMLHGWKGRILFAISCWKSAQPGN